MSRQRGLMLAAPQSGSGKTVLALALARALHVSGVSVSMAKAGPDYIDPGFHAVATDRESVNLDPWAMRPESLLRRAARQEGEQLLVEGMMGLFDGAADGSGSSADLASLLRIPVVLVVDASRQSHSIAALARGFRDHRADVTLAGVIANRIGGERHGKMLQAALADAEIALLGAVPRSDMLLLPERHLGLVQAREREGMEEFIARAADFVARHCNLGAIADAFAPVATPPADEGRDIAPLGQRIAIAQDEAFSFLYPHLLYEWRAAGAEIVFFSPLADEAPDENCDAVFLPGGYPELHAGRIAAAGNFLAGLRRSADRGALLYGECGGYMVLGEGIEDGEGRRHAMTGLLALETSFARRSLHLGYRYLQSLAPFPCGEAFTGHEFHYSAALREEGEPAFAVFDASGNALGKAGLRRGNVIGSYMHVIDCR